MMSSFSGDYLILFVGWTLHTRASSPLICLVVDMHVNLVTDTRCLSCSEGQVVYHGPRESVMPFFNSLGFDIPHRKGVADFLQEVRSPLPARYAAYPMTLPPA